MFASAVNLYLKFITFSGFPFGSKFVVSFTSPKKPKYGSILLIAFLSTAKLSNVYSPASDALNAKYCKPSVPLAKTDKLYHPWPNVYGFSCVPSPSVNVESLVKVISIFLLSAVTT